jgi:hypothetical protein
VPKRAQIVATVEEVVKLVSADRRFGYHRVGVKGVLHVMGRLRKLEAVSGGKSVRSVALDLGVRANESQQNPLGVSTLGVTGVLHV